jgi:serine/threonine protein kinase
VARSCDYARQAALGLQHAHEQGLVHRDIKPHNLMLTAQGRVKILDFGLARFVSEAGLVSPLDTCPPPDGGSAEAGPDTLHEAATVVRLRPSGAGSAYIAHGTPDYMAPEEAVDPRGADIRADVYSLGCTLYHLLTGWPPFPDGDVCDKLRAHQEKEATPASELCPGLPSGLDRVLSRMMAKAPQDRYQAPAEVAAALAPFTMSDRGLVLVVEDDPHAREGMAAILKSHGFSVATAPDGRAALSSLRAGPRPDLILLDLMMPGMDGWQFLRERQRDAALAGIPVVIVSAADPQQARAAALGAAGYLRKPVDLDEMATKVQRYSGNT